MMTFTPEQEVMISNYIQKYNQLGMSTEPADFEQAKEAVLRIYELASLAPPKEILYCPNPVLAAYAGDRKAYAIDRVGGRSLLTAQLCLPSMARWDIVTEGLGYKLQAEAQRQAISQLMLHCGGIYAHGEFVIIYDRPSVLQITERNGIGILHCETGPAIAWGRDASGKYAPNHRFGWALYYFQGIRVPKAWIMDKPGDDPKKQEARVNEIFMCENQEERWAGCEILGWMTIIERLRMNELDVHPNPMFGRLVEVDFPNAPHSKFLIAQCGTGRTVAVPAHLDAKTAIQAGAMSYNLPENVYATLKVRT